MKYHFVLVKFKAMSHVGLIDTKLKIFEDLWGFSSKYNIEKSVRNGWTF